MLTPRLYILSIDDSIDSIIKSWLTPRDLSTVSKDIDALDEGISSSGDVHERWKPSHVMKK